MPINHFDLQRLAAVRIKENIKKKGSPDRFGKDSSGQKDKDARPSLLNGLLKKHADEQK
ncbi:hypothetical protein [Silvimonas iriomotensis]|uniref:Uncharacterized protein n=1 Tax=Silvimonas iriomotensis TaxID=449662 RepID=A0ABQ2PBV4_9NEIS|nr:hypothetical protein [Silvimonas iriomotensis]GGP22749.1 hypothetical protein GCM10010970_27490 [Silvimonas iriomotensis]